MMMIAQELARGAFDDLVELGRDLEHELLERVDDLEDLLLGCAAVARNDA